MYQKKKLHEQQLNKYQCKLSDHVKAKHSDQKQSDLETRTFYPTSPDVCQCSVCKK